MSHQSPSPHPPRWVLRLLTLIVATHLQEEVLGDLDELFYKRLKRLPPFTVRFLYLVDVLLLLHPRLWRRESASAANYTSPNSYPQPFILHPAMLRNYITIATRNLLKNKVFGFINVLGLSLGMVCCLFIFLWVADERSVDTFHANGQNLYTAYQTISANGKADGNYNTPVQFADKKALFMLEDAPRAVPEIQHIVFYATGYELPWGHAETCQVGDKKFKLEGSRASQDFFTMFSYPLLAGNAQTALKDVRSVAISRKTAELFFGDPYKAVGKTLRYENKLDLMITAVFDNLPGQSSLHFDFLLSWEAQKGAVEWSSNNFRTFVQLSDGADPNRVATKINRFLQPRLATPKDVKTQISLQAIGDQYLHSTFINGKPEGGRIEYVRIFTGVALFILFIACINFMNLATAQSVKRAKEVGVRKVLGSTRMHLIGQFYSEALLLACLAMVLTVLSTLLLLPAFNTLTGKHIEYPFMQVPFWVGLLGLTVLTGMLAGSYPALFLSSLEPVRILKGILRFTKQSVWFRQGLTVFQFGISIILLVATLVVSRQTHYVQHTHLGYNRDNLIYIRIEGELISPHTYQVFKEQATKSAGVAMVDRSSEAPHAMGFVVDGAGTNVGDEAINWEGKPKNASVGFKPTSVGFDFVRLMNLTLVEGRDFDRNNATDSTDAFLVNEEAVRQMGLKQPLGKWISAWQKKGHIIGVLKDYHTHSLHEPIKPLIVDVKEYEYFGVLLVRLEPGMTKQALANLETIYSEINPHYPFTYQFLDQEYAQLYRTEQVMAKLTTVFTALAIAISCLGLFGLVMFSAQQRTKEIGVRKVLGASITSITTLLSKDYLKLILIAIAMASPIAWYTMQHWLADFAYKISIEWWMFALAGWFAFTIALLPVGFQSLKAALVNPVKSLRSE